MWDYKANARAMLIAALLVAGFLTYSAASDKWLRFQNFEGRWGVGWESSESGGWGITEEVTSDDGRDKPLPLRKGFQGFCFLTRVGVVPTKSDPHAAARVGLDAAAGTWYLYANGIAASASCATFTPKKRA